MPEIAGQVAEGFADAVREHEEQWLSPLAVRSYETRGREVPEEECRLRTPFQRDRDRIVHSKAFRRLRHKTQVFVDPEGDHFRTRLTHTLEAAGIARGVARALRLNEDLTEAVAVGHDVGHPPFGHAGEQALDELLRERGGSGFRHNEHSLRVVERFERVYLSQDHGPPRAAVRRIFEELVDARGMDVEEATDYLAGMTDRFALSYAAELDS